MDNERFGGNNVIKPVLDAYQMGVKEHSEKFMRARFELSAARLLKNIFRVGLFENPYLNVELSKKSVGQPEYMKAGFEAQLKSLVLLKNHNHTLPMAKNKKVYIPQRYIPETRGFFGAPTAAKWIFPSKKELIARYYQLTENPDEADFALVFIESPKSGAGYDKADLGKGGNGYLPISLQYQPYTASLARPQSMGGGSPFEKSANRSYKDKNIQTSNLKDLKTIEATRKKMGNKPVVVSLNLSNPTIVAEFESLVDAILIEFDVQHQAIFDILSGQHEPSGLLPLQMPLDMNTVETQSEDLPFDMKVYQDTDGNKYDFGFGMNWKGVIEDQRTKTFKRPKTGS